MRAHCVAVPATATAAVTRLRSSSGTAVASAGPASPASAPSSSRVGGSEWRCRSEWRTTPTCVDTWKGTAVPSPIRSSVGPLADRGPGRAAADVDDEQALAGPRVARRRGAEEGQLRLLVAAQRPALEAVAVAHGGGELAAVGRVAHRRGHHRGRRGRAQLRDRLRVLLERGEHALLGRGAERARGVDALPEPGDDRAAVELLEPARGRVDVGDEQPRRVRADVDDGDAGQLAGWGIGSPARPASRLATAISVMRWRVRTVAEPMCGTTSRLGARSSGCSAGSGSGSVTSSAAPAIVRA